MPRGPRLDAPGVLHHVMARGIERRVICRDDRDRGDFRRRLTTLAQAGAVTLSAWALLPNHVHLRVRTGQRPLAGRMRSLLTGYAGAFNRRHRRTGHLFQNRYQAVVVEEEPYVLERVRYGHRNPLRAGGVPDLRALARDPWSGHAGLGGRRAAAGQDTQAGLARVAPPPRRRAQARYRAFGADGGGLGRSGGGWGAVRALRRGQERWAADERILGSRAVGETLRRAGDWPVRLAARGAGRAALPSVLERGAAAGGVTPAELGRGSRRRVVAPARAVVSSLAVRELGLPMTEVARALGISATVVRAGLARANVLVAARGFRVGDLLPAPEKPR